MCPPTRLIAISACIYNAAKQHCACDGDTALKQSKLLPSDVTIDYIIVNKICEKY